MDNFKPITIRQLGRLPIYLKYLHSLRDEEVKSTSAPLISKALGINEEVVRKDLQVVASTSGKPKSGRDVNSLIKDIEGFLGYNDVSDAVIIGVGHLGQAFLNYHGFEKYGLNILVGFDNDLGIIGNVINGKQIYSIDRMENLIPRLNVHIAILTVPSEVVQDIARRLVECGIKAIWNFAPVHLDVDESKVVVENVNLASSLAVLSHKLKDREDYQN